MRAMNIQERYEEIAKLSGCSEQTVRRVMKAVQQSLVQSLKTGKNATLPGVCTLYPEIRTRLDAKERVHKQYIKIKAKASSALETEFSKTSSFTSSTDVDLESVLHIGRLELHNPDSEDDTYEIKNIVENAIEQTSEQPRDKYGSVDGVRTEQLNALL